MGMMIGWRKSIVYLYSVQAFLGNAFRVALKEFLGKRSMGKGGSELWQTCKGRESEHPIVC